MKKEKGIDDIFRPSLQDPVNEPEFAERDWNALEDMLDKNRRGGRVIWLPYLSAVAAVLLIAFCWWMFKPAATNTQNAPQVVKAKPTTKQPKVGDTAVSRPVVAKQQPQPGSDDAILKPTTETKDNTIIVRPKTAAPQIYTAGISNRNRQPVNNGSRVPGNTSKGAIEPTDAADFSAIGSGNAIVASMPSLDIVKETDYHIPVVASSDMISPSALRPMAVAKTDLKKTSSSSFRPQFALTVLGSPEVNGVGSFQSASKGTNLGIMFTVGVKKFTLSTGANYSLKPYSLPYSQYPSTNTYKNTPETVTADCRMLDIPINIGYQVFNKSSNKITLGTGLSSYIMMHESYTYDYAASAKKVYGPSYYAVEGKGKYLFSIMNVHATYERQVSSKFGLSLQPYFKIPLSEIGYSRVRVQTFGVALGINWNINSITKPK